MAINYTKYDRLRRANRGHAECLAFAVFLRGMEETSDDIDAARLDFTTSSYHHNIKPEQKLIERIFSYGILNK
jgi:hypothetical protein